MQDSARGLPVRALLLATATLTLSFATWTLIAPLAPFFQVAYGLTNTQISLVIATPVLIGSLGRLLLGTLADRYGGRLVLTFGVAVQAIPLLLIGLTNTYVSLLAAALALGIAGALFAAGVPFVSKWFPGQRQGFALGIYGMGNLGTAVAALAAPRVANLFGWRWVFWGAIPLVLVMAVAFHTFAQDAPQPAAPAKSGLRAVLKQPLAWLFSYWYFITFGGFVAFGGYLPKLYTDLYALEPTAAGGLASVFVLGATFSRPVGGWLADRIGGARAVTISLAGVTAMAALLTLALPLVPFTLSIVLLGLFLGVGNGAVFKLVPQYFPNQTGAVTGLVSALGGLGGFFPPLVMGALRDRLGTYTPAFALLAAAAVLAWFLIGVLAERQAPWQRPREQEALVRLERAFASRAAMNGFLVTIVLMALIYVGTDRLHHFDPVLYVYAVTTIVAVVGMTIRITAWLMRPATRTLFLRSLRRLFLKVDRMPGVTNPVPAGVGRWFEGRRHPGGYLEARDRLHLPATPAGDPGIAPELEQQQASPGRPGVGVAAKTLVNNIVLNRFIFRRGVWRGLQHFFLMWGVLGSFAITVPLAFGWLHFQAVAETHYQVIAFSIPLLTMPVRGLLAGMIYHALSFFAVLTLVGLAMMLIRRLLDKDVQVDQRTEYDLFPLYLLLSVTLTGLFLTFSHGWAGGWGYPALSVIHLITVVGLMLYLPFGKLFHIPMRSLAIGSDVYHEVGAHEGLIACARCQKIFATQAQIRDVIAVLRESGLSLMAADGVTHLAEYCPECKRVIRGLIYSRRALRPEEIGSPNPLMASPPPTAQGQGEGSPPPL